MHPEPPPKDPSPAAGRQPDPGGCGIDPALPTDSVDRVAAQILWDALNSARLARPPADQTAVEDQLFRLYLPLTRAAAAAHQATASEQAEIVGATELGLSHAILRWRRKDSSGFDRFARTLIANQLRQLSSPPRRRRVTRRGPDIDPEAR